MEGMVGGVGEMAAVAVAVGGRVGDGAGVAAAPQAAASKPTPMASIGRSIPLWD